MAQQTVEVLNLPQVLKGFALLRAGAPNAVAGESNVSARLISRFSKGIAPVKTGQYRAGISPLFAKKTGKRVEAEVRARAPQSQFVEAGTGRRGAASWKNQITGYVHGSRAGMKAFNILDRAVRAIGPSHRKRIAAAINRETQ
ncbi:MAG: hypothetical protein V3U84_00015 [Thiotrichaceae bacterium]